MQNLSLYKKDFFLNLRDYVQRAFASVVNEHQKDQVERVLKEKLTNIFNSPGGANAVDWENEPLPMYVYFFLLKICHLELIFIKLPLIIFFLF